MVQYYILIKRKGAKRWSGVIPAKKSVSLSVLKSSVAKRIKKGFTHRIITQSQLKKIFSSILKRKR